MVRSERSQLAWLDRPFSHSADAEQEEGLLSRTFQRGFAAGQAVSSQKFTTLLPWILEEFITKHAGDPTARKWAEAFVKYSLDRSAKLGVELSYVTEGAGI